MENQTDGVGQSEAIWIFCGAFPLTEIAKGRRACRDGWRKGGDLDMLAVVECKDHEKAPYLGLQRETAELTEIWDAFSDIEDMLATDWFLEQETVDTVHN